MANVGTTPVVATPPLPTPVKEEKKEVKLKIALVTGANKGIGYAICEKLGKINGIHIIVGARDEKRGNEAVDKLKQTGITNISFKRIDLDETAKKSIEIAAAEIKEEFGGLDILINNAGMAFKGDAFNETVATVTIGTNYYGTLRMCQEFLPLMRVNGRVINIASQAGERAFGYLSQTLKDQFIDPNITFSKLNNLVSKFIADVKADTYAKEGWPKTTYGISKLAEIIMTSILAKENKIQNLLINSCCPGYVKTDMAGPNAPLTPAEGAETPVFLATLEGDGKGGPTGLFYYKKVPVSLNK